MPRESDAKAPQVLYIGRTDPNHEKLWQQFEQEGINVVFARTQRAGLQMAWEVKPPVVVVNTANGAFTGERLCRTLGRLLPNVQRLLLTEAGAPSDAPCERRLARPFTVAKLRDAILKLLEAADPHILRVGGLQLDLATRIVIGPKGQQRLTPKQCNLLAYFMRRPNQIFSRRQLMKDIWDTPYIGDTRTLDVHIRWLREKLEPNPEAPTLLLTRRGIGYLFSVPQQATDRDTDADGEPETD